MVEIDDRWHATHRQTGARVRTNRYGIGKRWLARWRDDAGVQRKRAFERRADAERFLVEVAADLARGAYVDPRAGRTTVREYAERWRAAQVHRATTAAQVETHLRRHVYPMFGDRALASVRPRGAGMGPRPGTAPRPGHHRGRLQLPGRHLPGGGPGPAAGHQPLRRRPAPED
jgi:hypothetical protein